MERNNCFNGSIVFMLDLQRTIDLINYETASIFMNQVDVLRKKFEANQAIVFLSSQTECESDLFRPLEILKSSILPNIHLGECYFNDGTFDPNSGKVDYIRQLNEDKIKILKERYLNSDLDVKFFAVCDDYMEVYALNEFQNVCPNILIRPSQFGDELITDTFSCYSTYTFGFDGVIESIYKYIQITEKLTSEEILEKQKRELSMIPGYYACMLFRNGDYESLLPYVEENKIIGYGKQDLSLQIRKYLMENGLNIEDNALVKKIALTLTKHIQAESETRGL